MCTPFGCYIFLRLPFGIKIAPEIFQKYNEKNFKDIPGVTIYIDDILIAANSLEEHDRILGEVFKRARELNIKFNPEKFQYRVNQVKYLGHIMSGKGISCDPDRIVAIEKIEPPKDKTDLQKLLGMINYVRSFIQNLAAICHPLKLRLSKYMINLTYIPGKYLYVADLLSRYYNKDEKLVEIEDLNELVHTINVSDEKKAEFKREIIKDTQLSELRRLIIDGLPNDKNKVNEIVRLNFKFKNEFFIEDDLIYLNERIIVPRALQKYILKLLHRPHLRIEKTKSRAKSLVYWPKLHADIKNMIVKCSTCQKYRSANIKEPMISHKVPNYPYQKIGMDILNLNIETI